MRISDWSSDVCSSDLARRADHQLVGQEDGERLVAHDLARAPDGMAKAKRFLLADIDGRSGLLPDALDRLQRLSALLHRRFKFVGDVEVILERRFAASGDERSEEHPSELQSLMRI